MTSTRIVQLANSIAANTALVDNYFRANDLPTPSFSLGGPVDFGLAKKAPHVESARIAAIEASIELQELLTGPIQLLRPVLNATSLQAIYKFEIAQKVPIHGEISFASLAELSNLDELDLRRILRFAIVHHRVFCEPRKGYVAHSAASRRLAENAGARDGLGLMFDECWQSMARTVEAMERFKDREPNQTPDDGSNSFQGHSLAHQTDDSMYDYLRKNPAKAKRFASAMRSFTDSVNPEPLQLISGFPWASIGRGTVVDVGGSEGHVSISLARAYTDLKFIVQDAPETVAGAKEKLPVDVADRVEFMAHDFFTDQPITADVYILRWVFHNWPDKFCIKILQKLIPALKPGARIVVNDSLVPDPDTLSLLEERQTRAMDMLMLTLYNAREREQDDWGQLFKQADQRFTLIRALRSKNSGAGIIEAVWEG
ncbi:MAG: hypothetical protein MMC33_003109 [Icmadophila ericetorum]|nr:hypothetical protein [Icmadophila ericetorum]